MNQSHAPFLEKLAETRHLQPVSFHMPGHKFNPALLPEMTKLWGPGVFTSDLNECLPLIDYLHSANRELKEAQALTAEALGAEHSFFLVNGSTVGNQAMLMAAAKDGDEVILARAAHRSVYAGLILSGARPVYVPPHYHPQVGFPLAVEVSAVAECLAEHPHAAAIHITSPNYYGYVSDVASLVALAHAHNLPLLMDEAHGAHFPYHPHLPPSAVTLGADAVVQSAHKTLGAITQAAWLHLSGPRLRATHLHHILSLLQSSSPNVLLTSSLDAARHQAKLEGERLLTQALRLAEMARAAIRQIPGLWCYGAELVGEHGIAAYDPTKLVIRVSETGLTGKQFVAELWAHHRITVEFADPRHIICSISMADEAAKVELLLNALRAIAADGPKTASPPAVQLPPSALPELILNPRQATFSRSHAVPLAEAAGEICAEQIIPYPPGVPLLVPGERLSAEMIDYLRYLLALNTNIVGPEDAQLKTVRVIEA